MFALFCVGWALGFSLVVLFYMIKDGKLCPFGFHKWGKWSEKFHYPNATFAFEFQERQCSRCGKVHQRTI